MKKRLFVTGGTGFIGRNLALALRDYYEITLGARNNNQNLLAGDLTGCTVLPLDITNIESVRDAFVEARPHIIIHAAATKYVDLSEVYPLECVDVNILGSQNVARVAMERGVETVLGISTDKAAPPIRNIYGLSKSLMERMFCALSGKGETKFACVRFGNVAWSTGSVFPAWKKMHDETGVIKSTGPEMRRFFFTVGDALKLIRTALKNVDALDGKILSTEMKSAQIKDLLAVWIEHRGGRWERVKERPGEREEEFLIGETELPYTTVAEFDGTRHYVISFNEKSPAPPASALSSINAERLTPAEMLSLIEGATE